MKNPTPVVVCGYDPLKVALMYDVLKRKGSDAWIAWDATLTPPPPEIEGRRHVVYSAKAFVAECKILSTFRVMDRTETDAVWIVESDDVPIKDLPELLDPDSHDVVLGPGYSKFSRKAVERVSAHFGDGVDWDGLRVEKKIIS